MASSPPLLQVEDLVVHYHIRGAGTVVRSHETVHAVDGVSFTLEARETLGLVGESGCGKSTTGRTVLLLERPTSGHIHFQGQDLAAMAPRQLTELRRNMQIVFQDPIGALNPRHTVGQLIGEPLRVHDLVPKKERRQRVGELLELVGLPGDAVSRFPHEFSGGQCQRIAIARSLAVEPSLLILDEPVSALDVSIQAQNPAVAHRPPVSVRVVVPVHRPRPRCRRRNERPRGRHVPGQDRRAGGP